MSSSTSHVGSRLPGLDAPGRPVIESVFYNRLRYAVVVEVLPLPYLQSQTPFIFPGRRVGSCEPALPATGWAASSESGPPAHSDIGK